MVELHQHAGAPVIMSETEWLSEIILSLSGQGRSVRFFQGKVTVV